MKACIACAEEIQFAAKLCKHCGTEQNDPRFAPEKSSPSSPAAGLPEPQEVQHESRNLGDVGSNDSSAASVKKASRRSIVLTTSIILSFGLVIGALAVIPNLNRVPAEQQIQEQETAKSDVEDSLPSAPSSLFEALGFMEGDLAGDVSWAECSLLEESIASPPFEGDLLVVIEQLHDVKNDKNYPETIKASQEFVIANDWALEASRLNLSAPRVSDHSDPIFDKLLESSNFEGAGQLVFNYPKLYSRYQSDFKKQLIDVCGLTRTVSLQERVVELARGVVSRASDESGYSSVGWWPEGYFSYYLDDSVAWKWADRRCSGSGACWHVDVISRDGCNSLYAEISISDSSGNLVDWSNDSARGLMAGQVAELQFRSFESGSLSGRLVELNCRT